MPGLEAFVDGVIGAYMAQQRIAGTQVSVVRDGQVLLVKGYGTSSIDPQREVDPERSLFRLGSISKTFTWLSLMQLAERGQLQLTDPVNVHLPDELDIPDEGFQQPIRIIDLMNHAAGFEDALQHLFAPDGAPVMSLNEHLRNYRPHRVREPGKFLAYSNYGTALAGALVAHVSGVDFETYVEQNIFTPLGMTHTTFREQYAPVAGLPAPMSAELAADKAQNLEWRSGQWQAIPHERIVAMAPAGAAVSTAADMAQYMLALLDPERLERSGVLRKSTFAKLQQPSFQGAPGLPAVHHGFFNAPLGTNSILSFDNLSHGGATLHFMSFMVVIADLAAPARMLETGAATAPVVAEQRDRAGGSIGIFVMTNSGPGARLVFALPERILAEYFQPPAAASLLPQQGAIEHVREYVGQYRSARRSYTKFEKLMSLPATPLTATDDGRLLATFGFETARFVEIGTDLFRQEDGDQTIAFSRDESGRVTHMITAGGAFERVGFFQSMFWFVLIVCAGVIASIAIVVAAARRRAAAAESTWARRSARLLTGTAVAWLVFVVLCLVWAIPMIGPDVLDKFVYGYPQTSLKVALAALLVASGLSLLTIASLLPAWRDSSWSATRKVLHTLAVLVFVALVLTLLQWNAIGLRYY